MEIYHPKDEELLREMKRVRRAGRTKRVLWGLLIVLVLGSLFGWLLFTRSSLLAIQRGPAMGETLPEGSLVLVARNNGEEIRRGDLILYETEAGYQIKRVTAIGGDRVVISPYSGIQVNGEKTNEEQAVGKHSDTAITTRRLTVENQELFVQGDQLSLSVDSRYADYETVEQSKVIGKVRFVFWPLYKFGTVENASARQGGGQ